MKKRLEVLDNWDNRFYGVQFAAYDSVISRKPRSYYLEFSLGKRTLALWVW